MESRKITIVSTNAQQKQVILSKAITLAELKADMDANSISYEGMTFYEGLTKTEILQDDSLLPTNVNYKGTITNDLVFMLTVPNKKIKSGSFSRKDLYALIKEHNLQQSCINLYGKNYTNCSSAELLHLIENSCDLEETKENPIENFTIEEPHKCNCSNYEKAFIALVDYLHANYYINDVHSNRIKNMLYNNSTENEVYSPYSDEDLQEMLDSVAL